MSFRKPILSLLAVLTAALCFAPMAASALTISPPTFDYAVNPGDTIKDVIKLYNEGGAPVTIKPELFNFTFKEGDETSGTPEMYPADEDRFGHAMATWINVSQEPLTIGPNARANLEFSFNVPKDAQPGGHYASIQLVIQSPGEQPGAVALRGVTGVLLIVRVNGAVTEDMHVSRFSGRKTLYTSLPVDFQIRLENGGNTHLYPAGNVFVTNVFGKQVTSIVVNPGPVYKRILPGSARRFDVAWVKHQLGDGASELNKEWSNFAFGPYKAKLVLTYGSDNKILTADYSFWVVPWLVLAILAGGLIALLVVLSFALKAYNTMVIKKYESKKQP